MSYLLKDLELNKVIKYIVEGEVIIFRKIGFSSTKTITIYSQTLINELVNSRSYWPRSLKEFEGIHLILI